MPRCRLWSKQKFSTSRPRLTWAELNGATGEKGHDFLKAAEEAASHVPGILGTDSKGGCDAVVRHEGPDLGLSNARAAIQGHQLKEGMRRVAHQVDLAGK